MPDAFGLMALVNAFMQGMELLTDLGVGANIVQSSKGQERCFLRTAWTLQILRAALLWCVSVVLAGPVAAFFAAQDSRCAALESILPVAAVSILIAGFNSTSMAVLNKRLQFERLVWLQLVPQVASLGMTLVWASVCAPDVWAVVAGGISASLVRCLLSHALNPLDADRPGWDPHAVRQLCSFGIWTLLSSAVGFAAQQGDRIALARLMSLEELGLYSLAIIFARCAMNIVSRVSSGVIFPILAGAQHVPERMMALAFDYRAILLRVAGAVCIGFALLAPVFFRLLYDLRFEPAGSMSQWLALHIWVLILSASVDRVPVALGNARSLLLPGLVAALSSVCGYFGFVQAGFGGFVVGMSVCGLVSHLVLLASVPLRRGDLLLQGIGVSVPVIGYGLVAVAFCTKLEHEVSNGVAVCFRAGLALIPMVWVVPKLRQFSIGPSQVDRMRLWVEELSEGQLPFDVLKERAGDVLVVRSTGPDQMKVVVKLWNRRGMRGWMRRMTRTNSAWREYTALRRLRGRGAQVPETLGYFRLSRSCAPYTEAIVMQDLGQCGDLTEHVKRVRSELGDAALVPIQNELIRSTRELLESDVIDTDHRMPNFVVRPCGSVARVDFEMARRVRCTTNEPVKLGEMLGTLIGSYAFALQPDVSPVLGFAESLAAASKASARARRIARIRVESMLRKQEVEIGVRTVVGLPW
jgi:O-antigen/teichoic acid export membrane protein